MVLEEMKYFVLDFVEDFALIVGDSQMVEYLSKKHEFRIFVEFNVCTFRLLQVQ